MYIALTIIESAGLQILRSRDVPSIYILADNVERALQSPLLPASLIFRTLNCAKTINNFFKLNTHSFSLYILEEKLIHNVPSNRNRAHNTICFRSQEGSFLPLGGYNLNYFNIKFIGLQISLANGEHRDQPNAIGHLTGLMNSSNYPKD